MLLISTLGVWSAAAAVMVVVKRRSTPPAVLLFPVLVVANYLVMSLGLARNTSGVAWEDELHNRPLVWAYFAVAVWTAAIAYAHLFGNEPPRSTLGRGVGVLLLIAGLAVPMVFSRNVQTFPMWEDLASFRRMGSVPTCLVSASQYIRSHSRAQDIVQDSLNNKFLAVSAISERQAFAVQLWFGVPFARSHRTTACACRSCSNET